MPSVDRCGLVAGPAARCSTGRCVDGGSPYSGCGREWLSPVGPRLASLSHPPSSGQASLHRGGQTTETENAKTFQIADFDEQKLSGQQFASESVWKLFRFFENYS